MDVSTNKDPNPKERNREEDGEREDEAITERNPPPAMPMKPVPATPDANPIDPRVGQP
jgi:hypothetical protein